MKTKTTPHLSCPKEYVLQRILAIEAQNESNVVSMPFKHHSCCSTNPPLTTSSADPHKMARFGLVFLIGVAAVAADLCPEPVSFNFVIFLFLADKKSRSHPISYFCLIKRSDWFSFQVIQNGGISGRKSDNFFSGQVIDKSSFCSCFGREMYL